MLPFKIGSIELTWKVAESGKFVSYSSVHFCHSSLVDRDGKIQLLFSVNLTTIVNNFLIVYYHKLPILFISLNSLYNLDIYCCSIINFMPIKVNIYHAFFIYSLLLQVQHQLGAVAPQRK